jgi:hypothetical protein
LITLFTFTGVPDILPGCFLILIKEHFFCDGASHHHKKMKEFLRGFALHPKSKKILILFP